MSELACLEICAGGDGQSRGLELAEFDHVVALEIDADAAQTLRQNRPGWNVRQEDIGVRIRTALNGARSKPLTLVRAG